MDIGIWKYSVIKSKCPRCHKGDMWETKKVYAKGFSKMKERCTECNLKYTVEQGFWYGAMYVSYALGVFITVSVVVALSLATTLGVIEKAAVAVCFLLVLMPFVFRYSRNVWINIFVHFDKQYLPSREL